MSEPKLISPLLDGFAMGAPLSRHDGVCCCPAMKEDSDNRYIVKIISVPASQTQLDALLLTRAYEDAAAAMDYFKAISDGVVKEAELLRKLSKLEGFLPYEDWQVVPMEGNELGYDIYLLSPYKRSLEKHMRRNLMTHLNAVNLGLDMCAAMAICRRMGYMYVDLKPSNIFISEDKEYRIGDLGFVSLDSLKYASLPTKYRSAYTAPEVQDAMSTLNDTVDIYAAGLILYQIYNDGQLPFRGSAPAEVFPSPVNADYEIAEIILKACAPDPADRWKDPIEMGQALVDYMQRNTVNDVPIAPPPAEILCDEPVQAPQSEETPETAPAPVHEELAFMQEMVSDETAPTEADAAELTGGAVSVEVDSMLAQAEELISHQAPAPVEAPAAVPVAVPVPVPAAEPDPAPTAVQQDSLDPQKTVKSSPAADFMRKNGFDLDEDDLFDDYDDDYGDEYDEDEEDFDDGLPPKKRHTGRIIAIALLLVLLIGLGMGGLYFYHNYYQQTIEGIDVVPFENQLTVTIDTDIDESLLTIVCTDSYGNAQRLGVSDGKVVFTDLQPDTLYTIKAEISGFHELTGFTSTTASTAEQTKLSHFTAFTGPEDGSVVLDFTVEGPETPEWTVRYSTEGEEARSMTFTGHRVTITGLTVDQTYTFDLEPSAKLYMVGERSIEFTASRIIIAENLDIVAFSGDQLTARWDAPADTTVESWTVRCYNTDTGYDETIVTEETTALFSGVELGTAYTLEVTAAGMTQPARTTITASPITITKFQVDESDPLKLTVSWDYEGNTPEAGWLLLYSIDGSEDQFVIQCSGTSAVLEPRIPGATYAFSIQSAGSDSVFDGDRTYECPNADKFSAYQSVVSKWTFNLCRTPNKQNWTYRDVAAANYTTSFAVGESISFILNSSNHYIPNDRVTILYVIRDADGNVVSELTATQVVDWYQMWNQTYPHADLTLPKTPENPGEYKLYLYFDGKAVTVLSFTVTE